MEYLDEGINYSDEISVKVIVLGKSLVGKSFSLNRMKNKNYLEFKDSNQVYISTIGFEFYLKKIKINNKVLALHFWDTADLQIYSSLISNFYINAPIFLIFYNTFDRDSFDRAKLYFKEIKDNTNNINQIKVLVRSKYEINLKTNEKDFVTDEEALEYSDKNKMYFAHIATYEKYETGINELIEFIVKEYVKTNYT